MLKVRNKSNQPHQPYCTLCKSNGESVEFYTNHRLRDENNNVVCPILLQYTCPKCKETGSHTASYCKKSLNRDIAPVKVSPANILISTKGAQKGSEKKQPVKEMEAALNPCRVALLPPITAVPDGPLTRQVLSLMLQEAFLMPPLLRHKYFMSSGYNPARYEFARQAAEITYWFIIKEFGLSNFLRTEAWL